MDPIADALNRLAATLAGQVQVTTLEGATGRNIFQGFSGAAITGTTAATIWTPNTGRRFVLRGFSITAIVRDTLGAAKPGTLYWQDSAASTVVAPVGAFDATAAAGTIITGASGPFTLNLHEGVRGSAIDATLKLAASLDIVGGVIRYAGVVWGVEEEF